MTSPCPLRRRFAAVRLARDAAAIEALARAEGLHGHADAVLARRTAPGYA